MKNQNEIWLNLGCSTRKLHDFVNVDIRPEVNPDILDDISTLSKINDESVDLIYACHVLEHFGQYEYKNVLTLWQSKLKKDGILRLVIPSFDSVVDHYLKNNRKLDQLYTHLWGAQTNIYDFHKRLWNKRSLMNDLLELDFKDINEWDWRTTWPHYLESHDDYSSAYLPHMDKENGILMSLNIQCRKK